MLPSIDVSLIKDLYCPSQKQEWKYGYETTDNDNYLLITIYCSISWPTQKTVELLGTIR